MPPTALVPGQAITPAPVNTGPLGVAQPTVAAPPVPTQIPAAQAPAAAATPASVGSPSSAAPGILGQISNFYKIPGQTALTVNAGQSAGNVAQSQFEQQKAQNSIKIQNAQNQLNPSEYTITKDPKTGGINIVNSLGDNVNLATYVNLTGANPAKVLQDAGVTDASDQKFIAAYNNLQSYAQAKIAAQNGDAQAQATVNQFQKANPGLANMELGQLSAAFMTQYGSYFGAPQQASVGNSLGGLSGVGNTLSQVNNPAALSAYENPTYATLPGGQGAAALTYVPSPAAAGVTTSSNNGGSNNALLNTLQQEQQLSGG